MAAGTERSADQSPQRTLTPWLCECPDFACATCTACFARLCLADIETGVRPHACKGYVGLQLELDAAAYYLDGA